MVFCIDETVPGYVVYLVNFEMENAPLKIKLSTWELQFWTFSVEQIEKGFVSIFEEKIDPSSLHAL